MLVLDVFDEHARRWGRACLNVLAAVPFDDARAAANACRSSWSVVDTAPSGWADGRQVRCVVVARATLGLVGGAMGPVDVPRQVLTTSSFDDVCNALEARVVSPEPTR